MAGLRRVVQPGPPAATRIESAAGSLIECAITAQPGLTLVDALATGLEAAGIRGGAVDLAGLQLAPFSYVIPAQPSDATHVAFYSDTRRVPEGVRIASGTATYGHRDGAPFLHAHALWHGPDGVAAGHILPLETVVATPCTVAAWGVAEAEMVATLDPETNFTLFGPVQRDTSRDGTCVLGRLRPGEDLVEGIEALCRRHDAGRAKVRSGIGSLVGCMLDDGGCVETVPTEFFLDCGQVSPRADITIVLVDETGTILRGRPARGCNPVLICAEIVLVLE